MPSGWGLSLSNEDMGAPMLARLAGLAEQEGFTEAWNAESGMLDGVTTAAAAIRDTTSIRVGTAVLNVFSRTPFTLAMTAQTLQQLSSGRFALGLGASSQNIVERWHGIGFDRPYTRMRETLRVVRALLDGETVSFEGETLRVPRARVPAPGTRRTPLWVGAHGPRTLELAGRVADGVILVFTTLEGTHDMARSVQTSAAASGRTIGVVQRVLLPYPVGDERALSAARDQVAGYCTVAVYAAHFERLGYGREVRAVREAQRGRDRMAARRAVSEEMLHRLFVIGGPETQFREVLRYAAAGVTAPLLTFFPGPTDPRERRDTLIEAVQWFGRRWKKELADRGREPTNAE